MPSPIRSSDDGMATETGAVTAIDALATLAVSGSPKASPRRTWEKSNALVPTPAATNESVASRKLPG